MGKQVYRSMKRVLVGVASIAVVLGTGTVAVAASTKNSFQPGQALSNFGSLESLFGINNLNDLSLYTANLPFTMPKMSVPQFRHQVYDITQFGAVSGPHDSNAPGNTKAINAAIGAASKAGGGIVEVPPGTWVTGPIVLKSNVNLHLETGALVQFTPDHSQYPLIPDGSKWVVQNPISSDNATNIALTGDGVFDGSGNTWAPVKQYKVSVKQWDGLVASGGVVVGNPANGNAMWWPTEQGAEGEAKLKTIEKMSNPTEADYESVKDYLRPNMVQLSDSINILIDGPTFKNSPTHTFKVQNSANIIIRNTKISNFWYVQNADGFDISADKNVVMYNDTINTGDDGIALESSSSHYVDTSHPAVQNIVIENVHVYNAHSGFAVGSDTGGGVADVYLHNDVYDGAVDGLRFKSSIGKGGLVHDIWADGIQMQNIQDYAITFNDSYTDNGADLSSLSSSNSPKWTPQFQDIHISNVNVQYAQNAMRLDGTPYSPIQNIDLTNVDIKAQNGESDNGYVKNITEHNVHIQTGVTELGLVLHQ